MSLNSQFEFIRTYDYERGIKGAVNFKAYGLAQRISTNQVFYTPFVYI